MVILILLLKKKRERIVGHVDGSDPASTDSTKLLQWKVKDARVHEQSKRDQFLMKLRSEFEITRSNLMNRDPFPSLDVCFGELLREEQRLLTQGIFKQDNSAAVAFAAQGKGKGRNMSNIQCYSCKEYGHIVNNCRKKFCNYCKQQGHIIKECPTRPQNRRINAFQTVVSDNSSTTAASNTLTREMVQQMILTAFSALGLQGSGVGEGNREGG